MSSWYKVGSITVTNGSTTVIGSGTQWILNAEVGEALYINEQLYEITNIASDTALTIAPAYLGATAAGQAYVIVPSQSYIRDLAEQASDLVNQYSTIAAFAGQGKFGDGTLAAPGIRYSDDLDTGFFRSAANEVTFVAGGVAQFKYNTSGLQFTGSLASPTVTGLITGTAVTQSATDTTANRLTKIGDFGLGGVLSILNETGSAEDVFTTRFIHSGFASGWLGPVFVGINFDRGTGNRRAQLAISTTNGDLQSRGFNGSAWSDFSVVYSRRNILGTVSESSGVPTGSVIERGSNANGEFVKFADGTIFCQKEVSLTFVDNATVETSLPISIGPRESYFAGVAVNNGAGVSSLFNDVAKIGVNISGGASTRVWRLSGGINLTTTVILFAYGRWF